MQKIADGRKNSLKHQAQSMFSYKKENMKRIKLFMFTYAKINQSIIVVVFLKSVSINSIKWTIDFIIFVPLSLRNQRM